MAYGGYGGGYDGYGGGFVPPSFAPPTFGLRIDPDPVEKRHLQRAGLWRHYGTPIKVGYNVLITSGVATPYPGVVAPSADDIAGSDTGSGEGGLAWFRGGITYEITSAEETILVAAGYTVT